MKRRLAAVGAAAVVLWLTDSGGAYWLNGQRWASGASIVMHLQMGSPSITLIDGSSSWNTVAEGALGRWNEVVSSVSFRVVRASTEGIALRNGINNVFWDDDVYGDSFGDAVAYAKWIYTLPNNLMSETDVIFKNTESWNSYRGNLRRSSSGGTLYDVRRVALHEYGHALGLGHPYEHGQSVPSIMNRVSNTDNLQTDDINGARAIYGGTPISDTLGAGGRLVAGQWLVSSNRRYRLLYQTDGNLVLLDDIDAVALWSSETTGASAGQVVMQSDGNLVVYDAQGSGRWASGTVGNPNARLVVQNDGNLVVYRADGQPLWHRLQ